MEFRLIETEEQAVQVFPVMRELREALDVDGFLNLLEAARRESGYRLLGAYENDQCLGLMGYRVLTDFVHGRHLYIDDLVTSKERRSQGLGSHFLERAKHIARLEGCGRLRLCTGVANERGKRFYEKNGWDLRAVAYKSNVNERDQRSL